MSEENKQSLEGFNDEVGSVRDEQAQGIENSASHAAHKTIDQTKKLTEQVRGQQSQALRKQLGVDQKLNSMKQKAGKKRMKAIGSVEVPQEAFLSVLSMDED